MNFKSSVLISTPPQVLIFATAFSSHPDTVKLFVTALTRVQALTSTVFSLMVAELPDTLKAFVLATILSLELTSMASDTTSIVSPLTLISPASKLIVLTSTSNRLPQLPSRPII